jgi:hypothetical protein
MSREDAGYKQFLSYLQAAFLGHEVMSDSPARSVARGVEL